MANLPLKKKIFKISGQGRAKQRRGSGGSWVRAAQVSQNGSQGKRLCPCSHCVKANSREQEGHIGTGKQPAKTSSDVTLRVALRHPLQSERRFGLRDPEGGCFGQAKAASGAGLAGAAGHSARPPSPGEHPLPAHSTWKVRSCHTEPVQHAPPWQGEVKLPPSQLGSWVLICHSYRDLPDVAIYHPVS